MSLLFLLIGACYYDNEEDLYQNFPQDDCDTDSMSYTADIAPILSTECAVSGCHAGPSPQNGLDLSQYGDVKAIADGGQLTGRITATTGSIMPPSGSLDRCDIEKIKQWVADGAPDN